MQGRTDRFVIVDKNGRVVNDAQGYGYTTKQKAIRAMWYHCGGGKQKIDAIKNEAKKFWDDHKDAGKYLQELYEMNVKEICTGEVTDNDIIRDVCEKYLIDSIPRAYIEYLP
jgi:hypothetical protein